MGGYLQQYLIKSTTDLGTTARQAGDDKLVRKQSFLDRFLFIPISVGTASFLGLSILLNWFKDNWPKE